MTNKTNCKKIIKLIHLLLLVLALAMMGMGCGVEGVISQLKGESGEEQQALIGDSTPEELEIEAEPEPLRKISIAAVGDIMAHMPQINSAYRKEQDSYDFRDHFSEVKPIFHASDLVIGNLETTLAGKDRGYSGYPMFNAPDELADALAWAGFDVLSTANNHSLDRGEKGLLRTLEVLVERGITPVGTHSSLEARNSPVIVERNGITIGLLAYTYGTNGIPIPNGKSYLVNLIDHQQMEKDITNLRPRVDLVVICMHWGNEYQRQPHASQISLANMLVAWGADIILGSHPHVIQPAEFINDSFVIYSLGNFISNQRDRYRDSGVILTLEITKDPADNKVSIERVSYIPTWVHKFRRDNRWDYRILPVEEYLTKYNSGQDRYIEKGEYERLQQVWKETREHLGELNREMEI